MRAPSSTETHRYPLRPVAHHIEGLGYDYELLECGHGVWVKKVQYGGSLARSRRCRQCPKMEALDARD